MKYHLAIDLGASSGRHILGHLEKGRMVLEEMHRFENACVMHHGKLCWNMEELLRQILIGMQKCACAGKIPSTLAIDTWGVDYVLLDRSCNVLGGAIAYRDSRTQGMEEAVRRLVPDEELYARTGIQKQPYNTIYQLTACRQQEPAMLEQAQTLLMLASYFNFRLTGKLSNEYTAASTTGLLDAEKKTWDRQLIRTLGLPENIFAANLVQPGTSLGHLCEAVRRLVGFDCEVIAPASHDTASAYLAVPAAADSVYISSGTWSLLGVEMPRPILTEESRRANFTNEGGYMGRYRYLKNIMGMWMLQSIRRSIQPRPTYGEMMEAACAAQEFSSVVDISDPAFLAPADMTQAIRGACRRSGQPEPETLGQTLHCVYSSMAKCYAREIDALARVTKRNFRAVHITGGGCQDSYLNQLTAQETGLPVYAGPVEGTALGNLMVQWIASGELRDLSQARELVSASFPITQYMPAGHSRADAV